MKKIFLMAFSLIVFATACNTTKTLSIIPAPANVEIKAGTFDVPGAVVSFDKAMDAKSVKQIRAFADRLSLLTGVESELMDVLQEQGISFSLNPSLGDEEYTIDIDSKSVKVTASAFNGFLYAIQSIAQMLPVAYYGNEAAPGENWTLPCVSIQDKPRFAYRGMLLDVCRHFYSVEEVKRFLDMMLVYKQNRFHWHLTEDQGWRIEIKKYPKLTEIGSRREGTIIGHLKDNEEEPKLDGVPYGGYYTQEQIKEIVAYADERGITVIPELDLPGHMVAALASYPELGCTGGPYKVRTKWGVADEVLCVGQEKTFTFIENVLTEMLELFPSEYIHIGGDECPKTAWENCPKCQKKIKKLGLKGDGKHTAEQFLQSYVTARIQKFLNDRGRKIIGWDEILEGELAEGATVMSWRGVEGGIEAANKGFDVIMTPTKYVYFDYYQSNEKDKEPLGIGGFLPIDTVYSYKPLEGVPEAAAKHILGVQANLWTEYIATPEHLEYMMIPRVAALSEVQWCEPESKNFDRFKKNLVSHHFAIYDKMGYTYSKAIVGKYGLPEK
ncbi:MAG: beta-N-acetylhexosaminidase [Candidatus Cryptobacteroides sp.]